LVRRVDSLEQAAQGAGDPARALAYLVAADRVIQVDDFNDQSIGVEVVP
jgi:acyl-CoA dehydrogenase